MSTEPSSTPLDSKTALPLTSSITADRKTPTQTDADECFLNFASIMNNFASKTSMLDSALERYKQLDKTPSIFSRVRSKLSSFKEPYRLSERLQVSKHIDTTEKTLTQLMRLWDRVREGFSTNDISLTEGMKLEKLSVLIAEKISELNNKAKGMRDLKNFLVANEEDTFGPSFEVEENAADLPIKFSADSITTAVDSKDIPIEISMFSGVASISAMRNVSTSWREALLPSSLDEKIEPLQKEQAIMDFISIHRYRYHLEAILFYGCCDRQLAEVLLQNPVRHNVNFSDGFCIAAYHNMLTKPMLEKFARLASPQKRVICEFLFKDSPERERYMEIAKEIFLKHLGSISPPDESQKCFSFVLLVKNKLLIPEYVNFLKTLRPLTKKSQSLAQACLTEGQLAGKFTPGNLFEIAIAFPKLALIIATRPDLATQIPISSSSFAPSWDKIIITQPTPARLAWTHQRLGLDTLNREALLKLLGLEPGMPWDYFNHCLKTNQWLTLLLLDDWINLAQRHPALAQVIISKLGDKFSPRQLHKLIQDMQPPKAKLVHFILERLGTRMNDESRAKLINLVPTDEQVAEWIKKYDQIVVLVREKQPDELVEIAIMDPTIAAAILFAPAAQNFTFEQLYEIAISTIKPTKPTPDIVKLILESRVKPLPPHQQHQLLTLLPPEQRKPTFCYLKAINKISENPEFTTLDHSLFPKISRDSPSAPTSLPSRLPSATQSSSSSSCSSSSSSSFFGSSSSSSTSTFSAEHLNLEKPTDLKLI